MLSPGKKCGAGALPKFRVCYLCGQQFGTASIGIHIPQCYDKKVAQWEKADPRMRGSKPKHPDTVDWKGEKSRANAKQLNDDQYREFEANMVPCPNCKRTFLPDRLVVHMRGCKPTGDTAAKKLSTTSKESSPTDKGASVKTRSPSRSKGAGSVTPRGFGGRPILPFCYLCGRQFGTTSLAIHVPQCYNKKVAQWEIADSRTRGAKPKHPDTVNWRVSTESGAEGQSETQFREFVNNLEPCPNCGRKFLADRLVVHLRSCRPGNASKSVRPAAAAGKASEPESESIPCTPKPPTSAPSGSPRPAGGTVPADGRSATEVKDLDRVNPKRNRMPKNSSIKDEGRPCRRCQTVEYDSQAKYCRDCGWNLNSKNMPEPCAQCGEPVPDSSRFCTTCGHPVNGAAASERDAGGANVNAPTVRLGVCPACEAVCDMDGNFCDNCGAALGDAEVRTLDASEKKAKSESPKKPVTQPKAKKKEDGKKVMFCLSCKEYSDDLAAVFCEDCGGKLELTTCAPGDGEPVMLKSTMRPSGAEVANAQKEAKPEAMLKVTVPQKDRPKIEEEEESDVHFDRQECPTCGRKFAADAYERHVNICKSPAKRKVFKSTQQRRTSEIAEVPKVKAPKPPPKKDWRAESEAFRRSMKEARHATDVIKAGGTAKDLPPPTYSENPDYVPCPHCKRRFAPEVAARHIPKCATTMNRPKPPPKRR